MEEIYVFYVFSLQEIGLFVMVRDKYDKGYFYDLRFQARSQNYEKRLLALSYLSARPHGTTRLSMDGFS
jgi:hypothetical protein